MVERCGHNIGSALQPSAGVNTPLWSRMVWPALSRIGRAVVSKLA
jgi:hypothetical protein